MPPADALSKAVTAGNATAVAAALAAGADAASANSSGHTPLDVAVASGRADIVKALAAHLARSPSAAGAALVRASVRGQTAAVNALLAAGAPPSWREPASGRTALHWAAFAGDEDLVDALLAGGADAAAEDVTGATPANWAADRAHTALAARLRSAAAPPSVLDRLTSSAAVGALLAMAVGGIFAAQRAGGKGGRGKGRR